MNTDDPGKKSDVLRKVVSWLAAHPLVVVAILLAACLVQCLDKAIYTDDALFVWAGQWIQQHPADFYGSLVNWWVSDVPMWVANWNPPLLPYVFAGVGAVFGWHELALHLTCLLFAFAAGAGIYALAQLWCARPLLATSMAISTPAFLVSSSTLMCDVPMLAFWVWAVVLWERAVSGGQSRWLFVIAGFLAGLAVLTKYSALTLLPMLPLLSLLRSRRPGWWLLGVVVVAGMVLGYELLTYRMYGQGLLTAASRHAQGFRPGYSGGWTAETIIGFSFAGGSFLPAVWFAAVLWRPKYLAVAVGLFIAGVLLLFGDWNNLGLSDHQAHLKSWSFVLETALLIAGGINLLIVAVMDAWQRRNAISIILLIWIAGVMFFAMAINWLINVRSFLPLVPAAAILLARRLEISSPAVNWRSLIPLAPGFIVGFSLVASDCLVANTERLAAQQIAAQFRPSGNQLWFTGHSTFQFYLQNAGARPIDATSSLLQQGDIVAIPFAIPLTSYGISFLPYGSMGWLAHLSCTPSAWVTLAGDTAYGAAGFYGANSGPVPFVAGGIPQHEYIFLKVLSPIQMASVPINLQGTNIDDVPNIPDLRYRDKEMPRPYLPPAAAEEMRLGGESEAAGKIAEAIAHYRRALAAANENPEVLNKLAWLLATASDHQLRNGPEAVQLAVQAIKITGQRFPAMLDTLGAAYAETGRFAEAKETAFAAMCLAQLTGQHDLQQQSQVWYHLFMADKTLDGPTP